MAKIFAHIRIPGAFWLALIAFVMTWLPELVPGADWLPLALLILGAIGKAVEVIVAPRITGLRTIGPSYTATTTGDKVRSYAAPAMVEVQTASKVREFLFG